MGADTDKAREEASAWLGRLERGLRKDEGAALREWLKQSAHRAAILELATLWHSAEVIAVLATAFRISPAALRPKRRKSYTTAWAVAVAACVTVVCVMLSDALPWAHSNDSRAVLLARQFATYNTAVGEIRKIQLPDGSALTLNTATRAVVNYWPHSRDITLPYGEASFHVMHAPDRPFNVLAGSHHFQAVGTDFTVRVFTPDSVEITVTNGDVKVSATSPPDTAAVARLQNNISYEDTVVSALETVQVEPGLQFVRRLQPSDIDALLAWQQGMLVFKNALLADALTEVNRYTTLRFVIADEKLRTVHIAGNFRTGDIEGLLSSLRQNFSIESHRQLDGRVLLTMAHPQKS